MKNKQRTRLALVGILVTQILISSCAKAGIPPITNEPRPKEIYALKIWSVSPYSVRTGDKVKLYGSGFSEDTKVLIGSELCKLDYVTQLGTWLSCYAPEQDESGTYHVSAVNPDGTEAPILHELVEIPPDEDEYPIPTEKVYTDGSFSIVYDKR